MVVAGLVLAAGSSDRLGAPKQLLAFGEATLLDASLAVARASPFDQRIVTLGAAADAVRARVDLAGFDVVVNPSPRAGCSSSIVAALAVLRPDADGLVLLLGDQPGVRAADVAALIDAGRSSSVAVCRYDDGRAHPFWFRRDTFADLATLHGDKGVWKLLEAGRHDVLEVEAAGTAPLDVDTWEDYERLIASEGAS